MRRRTADSRASTKSIHESARSLRRFASLLSTFAAVAGVQRQRRGQLSRESETFVVCVYFFGPVFNEANEPSSTCRLRFQQ